MRGAYLGGGSINNPEKTYHLEWVWLTESDELDTIIGNTEGAQYIIIIELTSIFPSCFSIIFCEIASPKPVPTPTPFVV